MISAYDIVQKRKKKSKYIWKKKEETSVVDYFHS